MINSKLCKGLCGCFSLNRVCGKSQELERDRFCSSLSKSSLATTDGIQINCTEIWWWLQKACSAKSKSLIFYLFLIAGFKFAFFYNWFKGFILFHRLLWPNCFPFHIAEFCLGWGRGRGWKFGLATTFHREAQCPKHISTGEVSALSDPQE